MRVDAAAAAATRRTPAHVLRPAVDAQERAVRAAHVAELGGEHAPVPAAAQRAPDQPLVGERPVDVGRVDEVDPELDRAMDGRDRLGSSSARP